MSLYAAFGFVCGAASSFYGIYYAYKYSYFRTLMMSNATYNSETKTLMVPYFYNGNSYHILFKKTFGSRRFMEWTDENENNVTGDVLQYMGISKDFHMIPTCPKMLGYSKLTCRHMLTKDIIGEYTEHENIHIL